MYAVSLGLAAFRLHSLPNRHLAVASKGGTISVNWLPDKTVTKSTKIELTYTNWRFFSSWMENFKKEIGDGSFDGNWDRLIRGTAGVENKNALKQHQSFIAFALMLTERLAVFFGKSVAGAK